MPVLLSAQKRNNIWALGDGTGLNFNTTPVSLFKSKSETKDPPYYLSSICSKDGGLLFYSDGLTVWNRDNFKLPKYNNWWPWFGNVMPLITPHIDNDSLYYFFGVDDEAEIPPTANLYRLVYLTIKMYNPGDIEEAVYPRPTTMNSYYTTLLSTASHVLAGTGHCNQVDTWITTHSPGALYSFLVTKKGVDPAAVITPVSAAVLPIKKLQVNYGNIKFSANSERLVIPDNASNKMVVFDFDNSSGKFSNPLVLSVPADQILEDVELSADASKLYFGSYEITDPEVGAEIHYIYQMDLNAGAAADIEKSIYKVNYGDRAVCFRSCFIIHRTMQLGPDGRIYLSRRDYVGLAFETTLGVIQDPSKAGVECHYAPTGIDLKKKVRSVNYNYIRSANFSPQENSIQYKKSTCVDQPVDFSLIFSRVDSVKWNFGDMPSDQANLSTLPKPSHQYPAPGSYKVTAIIYDRCFIDTATTDVVISQNKVVKIPANLADTFSCIGGGVLVDGTTPNAKQYFWADGYSTPQRIIDKEGAYTLTVSNECSNDTKVINVTFKECPCKLSIPNAFSPNNDGLNEIFRPIFECQPNPKQYTFKIYDRYGGVVFQSNNILKGWDGKKQQGQLPIGIYLWIVEYQNPATKKIIRSKGTVTLLR